MITTLKKHGNSHALIVTREMMEQMGIEDDTPLQVEQCNGSIVVKATNLGVEDEELRGITKQLRKRYGPMLKRLAE